MVLPRLDVGSKAIDPAYISLTIHATKVTDVIPLTVSLTETDLSAGFGDQVAFSTTNTANFTSASTATTATYYDTTDTAFGTQNQLFSRTLSSTNTDTSATGIAYISGLFSITKTIVWTPGSTSLHPLITAEVDTAPPEPVSLSLLGSALVAVGTVRWFRRNQR